MGMDAEIFVRVENSNAFEELIFNQYHLIPKEPDNAFFPETATHRVYIDGNDRYYAIGYERGLWPLLASVLMDLLSCESIGAVWYGPDTVPPESLLPFDRERLFELTTHWLENANRPYNR